MCIRDRSPSGRTGRPGSWCLFGATRAWPVPGRTCWPLRSRHRVPPGSLGWPGRSTCPSVAFMAPRSGKSTALAIPAILEAPGAVIATANKSDLVLATRALRQKDTNCPAGLFDPMGIMHEPQAIWFDLLSGVRGVSDANALAEHFMAKD